MGEVDYLATVFRIGSISHGCLKTREALPGQREKCAHGWASRRLAPGQGSFVFEILLDLLPVFTDVRATGSLATRSTLPIIGGIDGAAVRAGIVFSGFLEPLLIANGFDSCEIVPQLDPMRHGRLECAEFRAGIVVAFATEVDASFARAGRHFALPAVGQPFPGTTTVTLALFR